MPRQDTEDHQLVSRSPELVRRVPGSRARRHRAFRSGAAIGAVALVLAVAACSGTTPESPSDAPTVSGEPIKLGYIENMSGTALSVVEPFESGQIATEAINAAGGIDGRPLELIPCDTRGVPAANLTCARQLVEEDGIIALIGGQGGNGVAEINARENVVNWMAIANDPADNNNPLAYMTALNAFVSASQSVYLGAKKFDAEKITVLVLQGAEGVYAEAQRIAEAELGIELEIIPVPVETTDFAPLIARVESSGADVWSILLQPDSIVLAVQAANDAGMEIPLAMSDLAMSAAAQQAIGAAPFPHAMALEKLADPAISTTWATYLDHLAAHDPDGTRVTGPTDGGTTNTWFAVYSFADIASQLPEVTRDAFSEYVAGLDNFDYDLIHPQDFTRDSPIPGIPRQTNVWAFEGGYGPDGSILITNPVPFSSYEATPITPYSGS